MAIDPATLEQWLKEALNARHALMTGAKVAKASYAQGDGNRMIEYTPASLPLLNAYIADLQRQLGALVRRAIGVRF